MGAIDITTHFDGVPVATAKLETLIQTICARFEAADATVSVAIVDDAEIHALNRQFLDHDCTTDCLSFDLSDGDLAETRAFELIVNGQMALRQATERGHASEAELALYVTHSLLHQLGFDDLTAEEAEKMHRTEDEILQDLGYGLVYNDRPR